MRKTAIALLAGLGLLISNAANAHLVSFGWKDQGNGTVIFYGQHWHGDQSGPSTANGGVRIGVWDSNVSAAAQATNTWQLFQWVGHINNWGGTSAQNDLLVTNGELDGWAPDVGNFTNSSSDNDWFYTIPFVIGNGTWGLFTGTNCCIDTMSVPGEFTLTGISSIPDGTGPGTAPPSTASAPGSIALLGLGLAGLLARRKFSK